WSGRSRSSFGQSGGNRYRSTTLCQAAPKIPARWLIKALRREIRDHRVEHRETVFRHAQPAVGVGDDGAFLVEYGDPARVEGAAGQGRIAFGVDTLGQSQSHEQEFVGPFFAVEVIVGDDAVAVGLDAHQPGLGTFFSRDRVPDA